MPTGLPRLRKGVGDGDGCGVCALRGAGGTVAADDVGGAEAARAVMDYGFSELGLVVMGICTGPENSRSQRVIEKCGFKYEGVLRKSFRQFDNSEFDEACYSLTAQEYFDSQKQQY